MVQHAAVWSAIGMAGIALVASATAQAASPPAAMSAGCDPEGAVRYVCGPVNAEDLIRIGDSQWLITSGMDGPLNGGAPARGKLYLVDHQARTWSEWFPGSAPRFQHDRSRFGDCPGPLDVNGFSAHGLDLQQTATGRYRLYVTGHGLREAIEVFDVDATGARPVVTWTGCVVLPADVSANSVAILPDGGFVTTKFMDRTLSQADAFGQIMRGEPNGRLYEWRPGGKVQPIAGTEMSGPNGVAVSRDGRTIYVAAFGSREFVRFERDGASLKRQTVKLDITPDNLRWTPDGKLLTAGGNAPGGEPGWSVLEIDPQSLAARRVAGARTTTLSGVSVGLRVGGEIWVGNYSGNRIGYLAVQ